MQALIDYAVAVVVGGVILLILLSLEFRGQQTSVDATQFEAAKKSVFSFVEMLERDLRNIGSQFPNHALPVDSAIIRLDTTASPKIFEFRGQTEPGLVPKRITYEWDAMPGKSVIIDGKTVPLLDVRRLVDGTLTGRSTNMITRLEIHLKREDYTAVPIFNLQDTRRVAISLRSISPLGKGDLLEEVAFEASYSPVAMTREKSSL